MTPTIGSLCSGYGGLDLAVTDVVGGTVAWHAQYEPPDKNGRPDKHQYAARILAHHYPDVPNHGDITAIDWNAVEPVDVLTAGFPCTDISLAGKRAGLRAGTRSGVWVHVAEAIAALRPSLVVIENVRSLTSAHADSDMELCPWCLGDGGDESVLRALGAVLGDLADLGFDAEWTCVRAADAGAPHRRERIFILAWPAADATDVGHERCRDARGRRPGSEDGRVVASDADGGRQRSDEPDNDPRQSNASGSRPSVALGVGRSADSEGNGRHEGRTEPARQLGGPDASLGSRAAAPDAASQRSRLAGPEGERRIQTAPVGSRPATAPDSDRHAFGPQRHGSTDGPEGNDGRHRVDASGRFLGWGPYGSAIERWERVLGRAVPSPTDDKGRLNPAFVEWMMGLPAGWVTDVPGIPRNAQLKALGNGVVRQQGAAAIRMLLPAVPQPVAERQVAA